MRENNEALALNNHEYRGDVLARAVAKINSALLRVKDRAHALAVVLTIGFGVVVSPILFAIVWNLEVKPFYRHYPRYYSA